ncbi:hypothetical protein [Limnoglobus roseus]|uniref:Nucleotide modification associated domain-containing protein n=1 Tax=Limnoglobus roseus TaxID=2598579 RepID=A0A5C1AMP1_9BACT|nr:hypothetical protein [Limnoglobus roseus]QEL20689.1 hypothetical protein PX52LOC_07796 [Limnoglobus roseus]
MSTSDPSPRHFINTYQPLVLTAAGRRSAVAFSIPPFVDGSIRREPDLEHPLPSITCLCRGDKFAPRLRVGDTVAYFAVKARYGPATMRHRRLTAVLRVREILPSHPEAARWYRALGLPLPNNCMVAETGPNPLDQSHRRHRFDKGLSDDRVLRRWDALYHVRARPNGAFVACEPLFTDLSWAAPVVTDGHLVEAFGRVPATRTPGPLPAADFVALMTRLGVPVPPSAR